MNIVKGHTNEQQDQLYYSLILFTINEGAHSERAQKNLENLCSKYLPGQHTLKIVDVVEDFQTALDYDILLTPTVVITEPKPRITIYGDLSDTEKFLDLLNLNHEG